MDKTSEKVTKDPNGAKGARKGREKYMNKLKKSILNDVKKGNRDTTNASNENTNASDETTNASNETTSTRSNDIYVYGVGMLAVLAIGVCVFFACNTSQVENKKQDQLSKRRHML